MYKRMEYAAAIAEQVVDVAAAAFSAAWPRSIEAEEIRRLTRDGYEAGAMCEVDFSLAFEGPAMAGIAQDLLRAVGFSIADDGLMSRGFVIVRLPVRLHPYDLALITLRLNRLVVPLGGFAVLVGPAHPDADHREPLRAVS